MKPMNPMMMPAGASMGAGLRPVLTGYGMAGIANQAAVGSVLTVPMNGFTRIGYTLSANLTLALSNLPPAPNDSTVTLFIKQAASGGPYTLSYPSGWFWPGGIVPAMPTTASAVMKVRVSTTPFGTIEAAGTWLTAV